MTNYDPVEKPAHYASGTVECIDAIEASMEPRAFKGFLKGNIQKYVWRYEAKGGVESLQKAQWYLNRLIVTIEAEEAKSTVDYEAIQEMLNVIGESIPSDEVAAYDPDDYMVSGCPNGFCPLPNVRTGPSESMFQPIN
jgi:hypothetical protein